MYDLKQGTPVPKPLESEDDEDTATGDIICEVARMDTFQQMCYGVFWTQIHTPDNMTDLLCLNWNWEKDIV